MDAVAGNGSGDAASNADPTQGKKSIEEKLNIAEKFKDEGNEMYKTKEYKLAAKKYHHALLYLKGIDTDLHGTPAFLQKWSVDPDHPNHISKETEDKCIKMNITVHNNLCACLLQLPDSKPERIKHLAEVVLELEENNEKALFRLGQACIKLQDYHTALKSYSKVHELTRGANREAGKLMRDCKIKLSEEKGKEKKMMQNMFRGTSAEPAK